MKKKILLLVTMATAAMMVVSGCGKKDTVVESSAALESVDLSSDINDKLEDGKESDSTKEEVETKSVVEDLEIETIGEKKIIVEKELKPGDRDKNGNLVTENKTEVVEETVGIVETYAPEPVLNEVQKDDSMAQDTVDKLQSKAIVHDDGTMEIEAAHIDVSTDLNEDQKIVMDEMIEFWQSETELGEDYIDYIIEGSSLASLSDEDKDKIKKTLMTYYPHTNTIPFEEFMKRYE